MGKAGTLATARECEYRSHESDACTRVGTVPLTRPSLENFGNTWSIVASEKGVKFLAVPQGISE